MLRHGIPEDVTAALQSVSRAFRAWGARVEVTRVLRDGDRIELRDRSLEVASARATAPATPSSSTASAAHLIAGDHLLGHISSNPLITRKPDGSGERSQALIAYLDSLRLTREMDVELVLPGHGDPVTDHRTLIDQRFAMHRRRADKIHRLVVERPRTAYEVAAGALGEHRRDAGVPDALGGARPHGPAARRWPRPRAPARRRERVRAAARARGQADSAGGRRWMY